jgi:hypothetical protein
MFGRLKIYTVHVKADSLRGAAQAYEQPVLVREGFNVMAFFFTLLWALYHRLWRVALAILLINVALAMLAELRIASEVTLAIVQLATNILIGYAGNDWLRAGLARRGYIIADIAAADNRLRAELRFFERHLAGSARA